MTESITAEHLSTTNETTEANNPKAEPPREQLLAAYERRYKDTLLESTHKAAASTNYSYLLEAEGLSVLTDEDLIAYSDSGKAPLYLGMPVSARSEGIDLPNGSVNRPVAFREDAGEVTPESCPLTTGFDEDLLEELRDGRGALTIAEAAPYAGASMDTITGADHPENGLGFYRAHRGHTVLALDGATDTDLDRAANRAGADLIGARFEGTVSRAGEVAGKLLSRLQHLGGCSTLGGSIGSLLALDHPLEAIGAVIRELHRRDAVRISVRGAAPQKGERDRRTQFISLTEAEDGALAKAAKRYAEDCKEMPARRAEAKARRKKEGQDKGFLATFVPLRGEVVHGIERERALFIERQKARYDGANLRGVYEVTLTLAGFCTIADRREYPIQEVTLYSAAAENGSPDEFFRSRLKGRILNGLHANGSLTARKIISTLFEKHSAQMLAFIEEGRTMSPQLAEPYNLFCAAARELMEEGKVKHTGKEFVLADPAESRLPSAAELAAEREAATAATEWADEDPEVEPESGPDAYGRDRYAADMPGAHDHRAIATGPQAPARRPKARKKAAGRVSRMIEEAKQVNGAALNARRANLGAEANGAWREALSVHMASLEEADRLELHLQVNGPRHFERMVEAAGDPSALFMAARELLDTGRLTIEKGESASERYTRIGAVDGHDREELSRSLLRVMARGEVKVPEGTRLARRVRSTKAAISREGGGQPED